MGASAPNLGANAPNLGANSDAAALFGKARLAVLAALFAHPERALHMRELARAAGVGQGAVTRELQRLTGAGILSRRQEGRQAYYQANPASPLFPELRRLVLKTAGLVDVLRAALAPLAGRIAGAFVYGSLARGEANGASDVDVLIVGDVTLADASAALHPTQDVLAREVNPTVYPADEFRAQIASGNHFLTSILSEPMLFLIGGARDLADLAGQRLADEPPH